jgi:hypothetical protein
LIWQTDPFQIVYINSLLATLNARKMIWAAGEHIQATGENLSVSLGGVPENRSMMVNYLSIYLLSYISDKPRLLTEGLFSLNIIRPLSFSDCLLT